MTVKFVMGDPGDGKTLYTVMEAHFHYWRGWNIGSNIELTKIPYKKVMDLDDLFNLGPGNWFIILDEFWKTMDARRSGSLLNIESSGWVLQHRKTAKSADGKPGKIQVWMTQQYESQMDLRVCNIVRERYYPRAALREDPFDQDSPPVFLKIMKTVRDHGRYLKSEYYQPVNWELGEEAFSFLDAYHTDETVDTLTASKEKSYSKWLKELKGIDKKSEMKTYLMDRGNIGPSEADYIANWVSLKRRGLLK